MKTTPAFDHIALTVTDLDEQVERLAAAFGMVVKSRAPNALPSSPTPRQD